MIPLNGISGYLSQFGCSPFFFTGAAQQAVFGEIGRQNQALLMEDNMDFRRKMDKIKESFHRDQMDAQLLMRRENYELGKQYMLQQNAELNLTRKHDIEFQHFLSNNEYWPLGNLDVYALLDEQKDLVHNTAIIPMKVLIAKTEVSSHNQMQPIGSYHDFCYEIIDGLRALPNVKVEKRPWGEHAKSISSICDAMNINFIMRGIPTLIIFPHQHGNSLNIDVAAWAFGTQGGAFYQNTVLSLDGIHTATDLSLITSAVKAVVGMHRDAYMMAEYRSPAMFLENMYDSNTDHPAIQQMLTAHYASMKRQVEQSKEFKNLSSVSEIASIEDSLNQATK